MKNDDFIEGINIIGKYLSPQSYDLGAGHDQFYFGDFSAVTDEADRKKLEELGWFESEDSWSCFV